MSKTFKPGKYFVGDPCYAIKDGNWSKVIDETDCFGLGENSTFAGLFKYNNSLCFADGTKYGDGVYFDNKNHKYGVDAGLIGIMPIECCDGDSMNCGNILEFSDKFEVWANDGVFHFGDLIIDTGYDEESEEEDEYWEDEETDEDNADNFIEEDGE